MLSRRSSLALVLAACLAAAASAEIGPFANEGGPPMLEGPVYELSPDADVITSMGLTANSTYSFAEAGPDGVLTERGTYLSWECVDGQPGYYQAEVAAVFYNPNGSVKEEKRLCEFGYVDVAAWENGWASAEGACPTNTTGLYHFFRERKIVNPCGTPDIPEDANGGGVNGLLGDLSDALAPSPSAA